MIKKMLLSLYGYGNECVFIYIETFLQWKMRLLETWHDNALKNYMIISCERTPEFNKISDREVQSKGAHKIHYRYNM